MADVPSRAGVTGSYLTSYTFGPPAFGVSQGVGSGWFGPLAPLTPTAPPEIAGRQWDFPVGYNLNTRPRPYSGITFRDLRELADGYDLLSTVIDTRKDQLARMSWSIKGRDVQAKDDSDPRVQAITAFFQRPDGVHCWADWLRPLLDDLFVIDAPTLYVRRDRGGKMVHLVQVDGATIMPLIDDWGRTPEPMSYSGGPVLLFGSQMVDPENFGTYNIQVVDGMIYPPAYQQVLKGLPAVDYTTRDLIYRPRNRRAHTAYGRSPVEQIVVTVNIALRRQLSTLNYFTEGNIPDMMIQVPKEWTPDQIVAYQKHWDAYFTGDLGARRRAKFTPGVGQGGIHETRQPDLKGDFDEWLAKLVCFAFSISPQALTRQMNRASADTQKEMAEEEGLEPVLLWLKAMMDDIIAAEFGAPDVEFAWDNDDEVDQAQQLNVLVGYVNTGVMTRNEARDQLGLDPLPDAEASKAMVTTGSGVVPLDSFAQAQQQQSDQMRANAEAKARFEGGPSGAAPGQDAAPPRSADGSRDVAQRQTREAADVEKYSADQPRDASGRWTSGDGSADANAKPLLSTKTKIKIGSFLVSAAAVGLAVATHKGTPFKVNTETVEHEAHRALHTSSLTAPLTDEEKSALLGYTGQNFASINKKLRLGHKPTDDVKNIDQALQKASLAENTVVYRGLNKDRSQRIMSAQPGQMFADHGYPSTSLYENMARVFANTKQGVPMPAAQRGYVMSINVEKGANALPLSPDMVKHGDEFEVLLPRSSVFKMLSVNDDTKTIYVQHLGSLVDLGKQAETTIGVDHGSKLDGIDPQRFLWSDADLIWLDAPDGDTTAEDYAGYTPPQPEDVAKAYDAGEARDQHGEWTAGAGEDAATADKNLGDAKDAVYAVAKGLAITAAGAIVVAMLPEEAAIGGVVLAAKITEAAKYAADTAYYDAAFKGGKIILRHLGVDVDVAEAKLKDILGVNKAASAADIDVALRKGLVAAVQHTRDEIISHLHKRSADADGLKTACDAVDAACAAFTAKIDGVGKVAKRKAFDGYRRPEPVPFDRPATRRAEKGITDRLTKAFAKIATDAGVMLKDRLGKLAKAEPEDPSDPEDRARQMADDLADEFDFGPLQDTTNDTADDLEDVATDSVSSAIAQIGPSDPGDLTDQVNARAVATARARAAEMVGMHWDDDGNLVPSSDTDMAITNTTRDELRGMIADALANNVSTEDLAQQIADSFALSPERAALIAATEVSRANSEAALTSYQAVSDLGIMVRKAWLTAAQGCCDVCAANAAQGPIELDDDFASGDDTPPGHPNCRCSLTPVVGEATDDE